MREFSQTVQIERHRLPHGAVALTFHDGAIPETDSGVRSHPLVFVQHGLGSRKERHLETCLRLARSGFFACAVDALHHGERATWEMIVRLSDRTDPEYGDLLRLVVQETVREISLFAEYFGAEKYGIIGHSMGGFIGLQSALADPHAAVVVNVAGSLNLENAIQEAKSPEELAKRTLEAQQFDPALNATRLYPRPILTIHGEQDTVVPLAGAHRLYEALQIAYAENPEHAALVVYPNAGHELNGEMSDRAVEWMRRYLPHG